MEEDGTGAPACEAGAPVVYCEAVGRAAGGPPSQHRTEVKGGVCMSDYEIIMIILTFLMLLVAVDKQNKG